MGKHRRPDDPRIPYAVRQHEELLIAVHQHRPGRRSGVCLLCCEPWPCVAVVSIFLPPERRHTRTTGRHAYGPTDAPGTAAASEASNGQTRRHTAPVVWPGPTDSENPQVTSQ